MPRFYFHVTIQDERFPDLIGSEINDLAAAHSHAMLLASRLMSFHELERRQPRPERWIVAIEDEEGRAAMSVIIRCNVVQASRHGDRLLAASDADYIARVRR